MSQYERIARFEFALTLRDRRQRRKRLLVLLAAGLAVVALGAIVGGGLPILGGMEQVI